MTMLKLVKDSVPSIEQFMTCYRVSLHRLISYDYRHLFDMFQMDTPAALRRIEVDVPATVEHSSEAGPETGKWIAETTQVCLLG